jgi:hypothetical protein
MKEHGLRERASHGEGGRESPTGGASARRALASKQDRDLHAFHEQLEDGDVAGAMRKARHVAWYPAGSDETILASLRSLCNMMASATDRKLQCTPAGRLGLERPRTSRFGRRTLRRMRPGPLAFAGTDAYFDISDLTRELSRFQRFCLNCGVTAVRNRYSLFVAYDPKDLAGRGVARYLQLALQRQARGTADPSPPSALAPWPQPQDPPPRARRPARAPALRPAHARPAGRRAALRAGGGGDG